MSSFGEGDHESFTVTRIIDDLGALLGASVDVGDYRTFPICHNPGMELIEVIWTFFSQDLSQLIASPVTTVAGEDFYFDVARGSIAGMSAVLQFGRNADIDTAADEDVWDVGGDWSWPGDGIIELESSSANDTSAGTGARTVEIFGVDDSDGLVNETVTMSGATPVATTATFSHVYLLRVATAGSTGSNEGTITAKVLPGTESVAQINTNNNRSAMAIYKVPTGKKAYIIGVYRRINATTITGAADVELLIQPSGGVFELYDTLGVVATGASSGWIRLLAPIEVDALATIKLRGSVTVNDTDLSAGFFLVLVDQ